MACYRCCAYLRCCIRIAKADPLSDLFGIQRRIVSVLVPAPVETAYSYRVPPGMEVAPGSIVVVPLGPRKVIGTVWDQPDVPGRPVSDNRLREIEHVFEAPPLSSDIRRFVDWISNYYLMPRGMVMRMVLRSKLCDASGGSNTWGGTSDFRVRVLGD